MFKSKCTINKIWLLELNSHDFNEDTWGDIAKCTTGVYDDLFRMIEDVKEIKTEACGYKQVLAQILFDSAKKLKLGKYAHYHNEKDFMIDVNYLSGVIHLDWEFEDNSWRSGRKPHRPIRVAASMEIKEFGMRDKI